MAAPPADRIDRGSCRTQEGPMRGKGWLKATIRDARRGARRALERARQQADEAATTAPTVTVTGRANIVATGNVGEEGEVRAASAEQTAPIRQTGRGPRDTGER